MTGRDRPPSFEDYRPAAGGYGPAGGSGPGRQPGGPRPGQSPRRRGAPAPRKQNGPGVLAILLYAFLGLLLIAGAGIAYLAVAPPVEFIRKQMIAQVKEKTGRDLRIDGRAHLTFYPSLGITLDGVSLGSPPQMGGDPLVQMKSLTVGVKLLPLLSRTVEVERFILTEPVFSLRVDKQGNRTWDFAAHAATGVEGFGAPIRLAQAPSGTMSDSRGILPEGGGSRSAAPASLGALEDVSLGDVRIDRGTLRYSDAGSGAREEIRDINMTVKLPKLSQPVEALGNLAWKGETIEFLAKLSTPRDVMLERPAKLAANLSARPLKAGYDGSLTTAGGLALDGAVVAQSSSARDLAGWLGTSLPEVAGFGPLDAKGRLRVAGETVSLLNSEIGLDGANATGDVVVRTGGARPHIKADLNVSVLDLNKYLPADGAADSRPARQRPPPSDASSGGGRSGAPQSIEDLLAEPQPGGPRVKGYTQRQGWSNEPIDVSVLGAADADVTLDLDQLLYKDIKVRKSTVKVALADRSLRADLVKMQLYRGAGRGVVTLDGRQREPQIGANFLVENVSAEGLLRDAAGIEWLAGTGRLQLAVASRGASERDIIEALGGSMTFAFTDGAISGFNVPKLVRGLSQGNLGGLSGTPAEKTDFSELSATFKITNGIAQNDDLKMLSPLLRVGGKGSVMLPSREVDYVVTPKLVANLTGQGGATGLAGLEIPVRIHGPFEKVQYTPDLKGVLSDPNAAMDTIRRVGEQFKGKKPQEIIDGLLGGGGGGGGDTPKVDAKRLLDGFLGR